MNPEISGTRAVERTSTFGRLIAAAVLTAAVSLAGLGPSIAAEQGGGACAQRAEAVRAKVVRDFGGDNVNYNFFKRADKARELCQSGRVGEAMSIIAAIKADLRGAYKELWEN